MAKIVILGAGLTGLSTAYHLEKNGFSDYVLFEKDATIGGLCRTIEQDGFTFDYTGHLLHVNDQYFQLLLQNVVGFENFESVYRRSFIYSHNVYTHYPFQINLHGLPSEVIAECIEGFVTRRKKETHKSFYEWALSCFGKGIARHFFFPYQKKIFAYDVKKITSSWTGRFVPSTSLKQMIQGAVKDPTSDKTVGYNAHFYYPKRGGIFFWVEKIAHQLKKTIYLQYKAERINLATKTVTFSNGHCEKYDILITTIPLDNFLGTLVDKTNTNFGRQHTNLLCNSVVNFNFGVNRQDLSNKHWIYFPENKFPFYRIGFPHNFSQGTVPVGCSSLYGEFSYLNRSKNTITQKLKKSLGLTKKLLSIDEKDIVTEVIIKIDHAYVIYDFWRERKLASLLQQLQEHDIYSIGRYGAWKYSSMQEAVLDGKETVEKLMPAL